MTAPELPLLSVLIPVYEEERTLGELLRRVRAAETPGFGLEILVCDDGSTDRSAALVAAQARDDPRVKLLRHPRNRGKGAAIRTALYAARGDFCLIQDADLEYEVGDYPALLAPLRGGAEAVYGSRFLGKARPAGMRGANVIGNRGLTLAANLLFGLRLSDEATCFKLVRTSLLRSLALRSERFELCAELTAKLALRGVPITEVPIGYAGRDIAAGKKIRWTDGAESLGVLLRVRLTGR